MAYKNEGTITVNHNGKDYSATYRIEKGVITVRTVYGSKSTQLGSSPPESLARMLLSEMIQSGDADA